MNIIIRYSIFKGILSGALFFISLVVFAHDKGLQADSTSFSHELKAENPDSTKLEKPDNTNSNTAIIEGNDVDTLSAGDKKLKFHSPQKATIFSAVLPGLGQAYNHKYWKIPFIYAGGITIYYFYNFNNNKFLHYKKLYDERVLSGDTQSNDYQTYKGLKDYYSKWRTWNVLFAFGLYTANVVDALADAYFYSYDISNNLTLKIHPQIMSVNNFAMNGYSCGFSVSLKFK